jgi:hypothetical protein
MCLQFCICNQVLCHQEFARIRDVVVFETRVLSSKLPWFTLLWPYVYFISSSFLYMLNVSEETGTLGFDEYWLFLWFLQVPFSIIHWCFQQQCVMIVIPAVCQGFLCYRLWQNIGFFICYNIRVYSLSAHLLSNSQFIPCLHIYSAIISLFLVCTCMQQFLVYSLSAHVLSNSQFIPCLCMYLAILSLFLVCTCAQQFSVYSLSAHVRSNS